jgi:hypothetical protein
MNGKNATPITTSDGSVLYVARGGLHNETGPAVIFPDGRSAFYLNNTPMSYDEWVSQIDWSQFTEREQTFLSMKYGRYMIKD